MIRLILVALFLLCFLILGSPLLIAEWIIGKRNPDMKSHSSLAIVKWAFRVIIRLAGVNVIIKGEEHIPMDTAVLYVGNHRSYFDVILTYVRVPRLTGYISKKEMEKIPFLSSWMRNLHCLFLDRKDVKQGLKIILQAVEKVKSGISIAIFPEGTRNREPDCLLPFHNGSFKIAEKGDVPIIPMSIVGTGAIWEDHLPLMKKSTVIIEYCEPVYIKNLDKETRKDVGKYVSDIILEKYLNNQKLLKEQ